MGCATPPSVPVDGSGYRTAARAMAMKTRRLMLCVWRKGPGPESDRALRELRPERRELDVALAHSPEVRPSWYDGVVAPSGDPPVPSATR